MNSKKMNSLFLIIPLKKGYYRSFVQKRTILSPKTQIQSYLILFFCEKIIYFFPFLFDLPDYTILNIGVCGVNLSQ